MEFTRQPIIETVITAKEGFKLVVRSSKNTSQEEYFVDAVEVVSFGNAFFFRSTEKPKAFLAPVTDYEVLEVREARMVLKNVGLEKAIKIGGGKETLLKAIKEPTERVGEEAVKETDRQGDRKRDRRRGIRKRRGEGGDGSKTSGDESDLPKDEPGEDGMEPHKVELPEPKKTNRRNRQAAMELSSNVLKSLLTPPANLISDTIEKYRDDDLFKGVFIPKEDRPEGEMSKQEGEAEYGMPEPDDEAIFRTRIIAKEHESEHYREDIEEGPSSIVGSFQDETPSYLHNAAEDLHEIPHENGRKEDNENNL